MDLNDKHAVSVSMRSLPCTDILRFGTLSVSTVENN